VRLVLEGKGRGRGTQAVTVLEVNFDVLFNGDTIIFGVCMLSPSNPTNRASVARLSNFEPDSSMGRCDCLVSLIFSCLNQRRCRSPDVRVDSIAEA
jgi:hypothetical protein